MVAAVTPGQVARAQDLSAELDARINGRPE